MKESLTLASGAELRLQLPSFAVSMKLLKCIAAELKSVHIDITLDGGADLQKLLQRDLPVDMLKNAVCQLIGSDQLERALAECMKSFMYRGEKIVPGTFEDEDARGDYLPVAWEVIQFTLAPFFRNLALPSSTPSKEPDGSQKSG